MQRTQIASKPDVVEMFTARAQARAHLWCEGEFPDLHSALDPLQAAAERTGVIDRIGMDATQAILSRAFAAVRPPCVLEPVDEVPDPMPNPEPEPGHPAAQSTVEAVVYALCEHGAAALRTGGTRQRIAELSSQQMENVVVRLTRLRAKYPKITDNLLLTLAELLDG